MRMLKRCRPSSARLHASNSLLVREILFPLCFYYYLNVDIDKTRVVEREGQKRLIPVLQKRRGVLKSIPGFWPVALMKHSLLSFHLQHNGDKHALSYLEDVWVEKDPQELRCFKLEFVGLISRSFGW